jgi:hypothetical protein
LFDAAQAEAAGSFGMAEVEALAIVFDDEEEPGPRPGNQLRFLVHQDQSSVQL